MADQPQFWNEPNLGSTQVKRQHYVPRMYLKAFTGTDGNIRVVNLDDKTDFRTSIENAAVENYFNDVEIGDKLLSTEGWLSELEGDASPVLAKLIVDPNNIRALSLDEQLHIARFMAALKFRVPAYRQWNDEMMSRIVSQIREGIRGQLYGQLDKEEADANWDIWKGKPDHWWLTQSDQYQPSATAASMLSEVQGYANLLCAAPWRIGQTPESLQVYTSDNPVAGHLRAVRPWWEVGAFASLDYFIPLSPRVLLKVERRPDTDKDEALKPQGERRHRDFSCEEVSFARHVVTLNATRYLFGEGLIVPRYCATACITRIDQAKVKFAMRYLGFDPRPPAGQGFPT